MSVDKTMRVITEIGNERLRQGEAEGFDAAHDDEHKAGELAQAAACYAAHAGGMPRALVYGFAPYWPWNSKWWKPKTSRLDLIKAAALIVAEIERLDRAEAK